MAPRACPCGTLGCRRHRRPSPPKNGAWGAVYQSNRAALLRIWNADPYTRCCFCGGLQIVGDPWSPDHIQKVTDGGGDHISNLRPAHLSCNKADGARTRNRKRQEAIEARARLRIVETERLIGGRR